MCELNNPQNTGHFHFILLLGVVDYHAMVPAGIRQLHFTQATHISRLRG